VGKKKRSNRREFSFAVGQADGLRSQVWTVWSQRGSSDVFLRAIRGQDMKVSLHDPLKSTRGLPWVFGATDDYMAKYNDRDRTPDKVIARWGPFGHYPQGLIEAVRVVIPSGELWKSDDALAPPPSTKWFPEAPMGAASAFTLAFMRQGQSVQMPPGDAAWVEPLPNGHAAVLMHDQIPMSPDLGARLEAGRAHLMDQWLRDVQEGRFVPVGGGVSASAGVAALGPEGHRLTILEWHALSYWMPDGT
jgi:hypothetical protein